MDQLLYLNSELFGMIENSISLDLLARLLSTQLTTSGEKHLLDHNRIYYKLLRRIIARGQRKGGNWTAKARQRDGEAICPGRACADV